MSYDDEEDFLVHAWSGDCVAYRVDGFHLYGRDGKYLGTHGLKPGTSFRANEIFRDGHYVGEIRNGRLLFDQAKANMRAATYLKPQVAELPPQLWAAPEPMWDLPAGCTEFKAG